MTSVASQSALLAVAAFAWATSSTVSSVSAKDAQQASLHPFFVWHQTTEEDLPLNRITCLQQTSDGYFWIGTWMGLARFDGNRFVVFNRLNTKIFDGPRGDSINALAQDNDGTLWIGTCGGLVSFRNGRFRKFTKNDGLPASEIWKLLPASSGGIWTESGRFIVRFKGGKVLENCGELPEDFNFVAGLHETSDGGLDIFSRRGWFVASLGATTLRTNYLLKPSECGWQTAAVTSGPEAIWIGSARGLRQCTHKDVTGENPQHFTNQDVNFSYRDHSGNLWAAVKSDGLYRRAGGEWEAIDLGEALREAEVVCMAEDSEGGYLVGTTQGLVAMHPQRVLAYDFSRRMGNDYIWCVGEGSDGTIWAGTDHGLQLLQGGHLKPPGIGELPGAQLRTLYPGPNGGLFLASPDQTVFQFDPSTSPAWSVLRLGQVWDSNVLYADRAQRLWFGGSEGVLIFENGKELTEAPEAARLRGYDVHSILQDRSGALWFGTRFRGLVELRNGEWHTFSVGDGLSDTNIWSIHEDASGTLWFGTGNGLTRYADGRFFAIRTAQGLIENTINCVLEDDFGCLWLSGLRGIHRVTRAELNAVAEGRSTSVTCFTVGTVDGMKSAECNGETQPAGWKGADGQLWFPTKRGLVAIDPKRIPTNELPPPVLIEEIKIDDQVIFGSEYCASEPESHLPSPDAIGKWVPPKRIGPSHATVLEIRYTVNTFVAPKRVRFRYRLKEVDRDWREPTIERTARYFNLRPGQYHFEVMAANHHNTWSAVPARWEFTLAPYFWQTWTFYGLGVAVTIGLGAAIQGYRLRWQHRLLKVEEQRALANERARIARDLHDDLGSALTGLALQADVAKRQGEHPEILKSHLGEVANRSRSLANRMREVVWAISPHCDNVDSLASFLGQYTEQFVTAAGLRCRLQLPDDGEAIPLHAEARHDLLLGVKEALNNVVKHAQATEVELRLQIINNCIRLTITDNGRGFLEANAPAGSGLRNMRERLAAMGGRCLTEPGPFGGTRTIFMLPVELSPRTRSFEA